MECESSIFLRVTLSSIEIPYLNAILHVHFHLRNSLKGKTNVISSHSKEYVIYFTLPCKSEYKNSKVIGYPTFHSGVMLLENVKHLQVLIAFLLLFRASGFGNQSAQSH